MNKENILETILTFSNEGFIVVDEYRKITLTNDKIETLTGFTTNDLKGKDLTSICTFPEGSEFFKQGDKISKSITIFLKQVDGKKISTQARMCELKNKNIFLGYLIIINLDLKDNSVDKAHLDFVSTVSHELRTPLTSIKGFADTLIRSKDKIPDETKNKYITIIKDQAERLCRLVEDLLSVSRLEGASQQLTIRAINLEKIINRVLDALSVKSSKHKFIINIEKNLPPVKADADRLEQILTNLIDNAIKYSPEGSEVFIKANSIKNTTGISEKIKIEIIDQGVGIKEEDLQKIFKKFGRLDDPLIRQTQGTGLGLFITKSLVLALKGEIDVKSNNGYTTFIVILPSFVDANAILLSSSENQNKR